MTSETKPVIRRVVSSNGRTWHTDATGTGDYLFNPVFMTFFFLCVILFATLMQPSEETSLPVMAQMILWGAMIMTSLIWLVVSVWTSVQVYDRGITKAIYTPVILMPLVVINTLLGEFVLSIYSQSFRGTYGTILETLTQNVILFVVFDIMHERYVAPQHPRYVSGRVTPSNTPAVSTDDTRSTDAAPAAAMAVVAPISPTQAPPADSQPAEVAAAPDQSDHIEIAREKIETRAILWLKSEDHYLSIQLEDRNVMLRGKLRTVVDELGDRLGAQINRSVWVAFSAVRGLEEQSNGNIDVLLDDDTVHRVSNARRLVFKQNYDRYIDEMGSDCEDTKTAV